MSAASHPQGAIMTPFGIIIQHEKHPSEELAEAAVKMVVCLTKKDPLVRALTTGRAELVEPMCRAMVKSDALVAGEIYTATNKKGELVGFALWLPPGKSSWDTEEQREMGLNQFLEMLSQEGKDYFDNVMCREFSEQISSWMGSDGPEIGTYWCSFAMVRIDYQGQGILRSLFELVIPKAKEQGVSMALTTMAERNVPVYEKLGFVVRGHSIMTSPWGDWPAWLLSREP